MPSIVGFAGSFSRPSRTRALVELAARLVAEAGRGSAAVFDLIDLGPSLGAATSLDRLDAGAAAIVERIARADALVVGSPVYKGSYTGLFKHLFDLIEPETLRGKPVLLTATGGGDRHALVIEHQLRPLFGFFEAAAAPTGVYASGADFADGRPASPQVLGRLSAAAGQIAAAISAPIRSPEPAL